MENTLLICPKIAALHNSLRRFVSETVAELRYHTHEFRNQRHIKSKEQGPTTESQPLEAFGNHCHSTYAMIDQNITRIAGTLSGDALW